MSIILYRALLAKVKALLSVESTHDKELRAAQQWQLFAKIDGVQFIVGKGGVNTMFYSVGNNERVLCYPDELITFLESLCRTKYSLYAICSDAGKVVRRGILSETEALKKKPPVGYYIVAYENGKKVKLFVRQKGLSENIWKSYSKKPNSR